MVGFIIGIFIGALIGVTVMCFCKVASTADRAADKYRKIDDTKVE